MSPFGRRASFPTYLPHSVMVVQGVEWDFPLLLEFQGTDGISKWKASFLRHAFC